MRKLTSAAAVAVPLIALGLATGAKAHQAITSTNIQSETADILAKNPDLNKNAVAYALKGYLYAKEQQKIDNPTYLTIVNFNEPDTDKRLNVIDLQTDKVVFSAHVAQGSGSGDGLMATYFSNAFGTHASSLGTYVTGAIYYGKHGRSEHVIGLEKGINSNAAARAIEIHPAWYVNSHQAGHSWGCFALSPEKITKFINIVHGGSVLFAYASPEQHDPNLV